MDKDVNGVERSLVVVRPSELRLYAYCPRLLFLREHLGLRKSLWLELRAFVGRVYHFFLNLIAFLKGFRVESSFEERLGNVVLKGRPDHYKIEKGVAEVVEVKSSKGPKDGVWLSDLLQVAAYGLVLARRGAQRVELVVKYVNGNRKTELSSELALMVLKSLDDTTLIKSYGLVPVALRGEKKCKKCLYRRECYDIDENLKIENELADEVGSWLKNVKNVYKAIPSSDKVQL
ncbi:MAG: CRISPR-associated protein Cas4 [Acidilobaceae archaeon]